MKSTYRRIVITIGFLSLLLWFFHLKIAFVIQKKNLITNMVMTDYSNYFFPMPIRYIAYKLSYPLDLTQKNYSVNLYFKNLPEVTNPTSYPQIGVCLQTDNSNLIQELRKDPFEIKVIINLKNKKQQELWNFLI